MASRMTKDRAKLILQFAVQYYQLERRNGSLVQWMALKLSCHGPAAAASMTQAKQLLGDDWDQAVQAAMTKAAAPVRPDPPKTPMIDQLKVIERQNHELVDFTKWLEGTGRLQNPGGWSHEEIVAAFRGIDLRAVAVERKAIEQYAADMQEYWRLKDAADAARGQR